MSILNYLLESLTDETSDGDNAFKKSVLEGIKKYSVDTQTIEGETYLYLYHGTSKKNKKIIDKTEKLNSGTFFSHDIEVSKRYSMMYGEKTPIVMFCLVNINGLMFDGNYFVSNQDLYQKNHVIWTTK